VSDWFLAPRRGEPMRTLWRHGTDGSFPCAGVPEAEIPKLALAALDAMEPQDRDALLRQARHDAGLRALTAHDADDCAHLLAGMSLPLEMNPLRDRLVRALRGEEATVDAPR